MKRHFLLIKYVYFFVLSLSVLLFSNDLILAIAQEHVETRQEAELTSPKLTEDGFIDPAELFEEEPFEYIREGRSDPFLPFITEEIIQAEIDVAEEELTGMRKYEPGQLKLVGILFVESKPMAMVQDSVGKGFIIREGTKIGRAGEVEDIIPNKVIIKQAYYTMAKEKKYKTVEMVLKKEGEK